MRTNYRNYEARLNDRLDFLHEQIAWIAYIARAAARSGWYGANGELDPARSRLIRHAEWVLDELRRIGGSPRFHPTR